MDIKSIVNFFKNNEEKIVLIIGGILIAILSFGAGRLTALNQKEAELIYTPATENQEFCLQKEDQKAEVAGTKAENKETPNSKEEVKKGSFVASKNSNKYHLPTCRWAEKIKEENKIWFNSKEEAEKAGYAPCGTCLK